MADLLYKKLYSFKNLELAWTRIKTGQNIQHKNYYRSLIISYGLSETENLNSLSGRIKGKAYKPSTPTRFYFPKSSGLSRPITFLYLDDLIIYQAFANIIAERFSDKRKKVENENVFSNILNRDANKNLFFLRKWQEGYKGFRAAISSYFISGARWVAHFDLAAYYDTISHTTLSHQLSRKSYQDFKTLFETCLKEWSSSNKTVKIGHGIPQGPIASDFLGEIYLLPIDLVLNKGKVKYVRYVDDIKIFGKSRREVLDGIVLLEEECKERGLIPHAKKFEIIKAKTVEEAIGKYPSLTVKEKHSISKDAKKTAGVFKVAFEPNSFDVSKVRYILKASPPNAGVLKIVLGNLNQHPELVDEFCTFLGNYRSDNKTGNNIYTNGLMNPTHFEYVEGKYWALLATFFFDKSEKQKMIQRAIGRLKQSRKSPPLLYGLYRFLASTNNSLVLKWLEKEKSSFIQMLIVNHISPACYNKKEFITFMNKLMKRSHYEPALVGIKQLIFSFRRELIGQLNKPSKDLSGVLQNTLGIPQIIDPVGQILATRYNIPSTTKWIKFFRSDYEHANELIFLADKSYYLDRNSWISYTDSFNDSILRTLVRVLNSMNPLSSGKSWANVIDSRGKLIDFGVILNSGSQMSTQYSEIFYGFNKLHKRRSKTPSAHPYVKETGAKTDVLTGKEQKGLVTELKKSYEKIVQEMESLLK